MEVNKLRALWLEHLESRKVSEYSEEYYPKLEKHFNFLADDIRSVILCHSKLSDRLLDYAYELIKENCPATYLSRHFFSMLLEKIPSDAHGGISYVCNDDSTKALPKETALILVRKYCDEMLLDNFSIGTVSIQDIRQKKGE